MDNITINVSNVVENDKPKKIPDELSADETNKLEATAIVQEEINAKIKNIEQTFAIRK